MIILLGHSEEGQDIVLTDEHPVCIQHTLPCVAIGRGVEQTQLHLRRMLGEKREIHSAPIPGRP